MMGTLRVLRGVAAGGFVVTGAFLASTGVAFAGPPTPPLVELKQVQSNISALVSSGDTTAKVVLRAAAADLEEATAEHLPEPAFSGLWVDSSDAVPPPYGNVVFKKATAAVKALYRIANDRTVPEEARVTATNEILEAENDLAANAAKEVQGFPTPPGTAAAKWRAAFGALAKQITDAVTSVPLARVEQAAVSYLMREEVPPGVVHEWVKSISGSALTDEGKPEVFYYGSEGCPFCAVDRWSMAAALARFGKFSPLPPTVSSTLDIYPATRTLTFYKAKFKSSYLAFVADEAFTTLWTPLQEPTAAQQELIDAYDSQEFEGHVFHSFPFLDFANKWEMNKTLSPGVLAGMSWQQIAAAMAEPGSSVGQELDFVAELATAQLCDIDGEQPTSVCASGLVRGLKEGL